MIRAFKYNNAQEYKDFPNNLFSGGYQVQIIENEDKFIVEGEEYRLSTIIDLDDCCQHCKEQNQGAIEIITHTLSDYNFVYYDDDNLPDNPNYYAGVKNDKSQTVFLKDDGEQITFYFGELNNIHSDWANRQNLNYQTIENVNL